MIGDLCRVFPDCCCLAGGALPFPAVLDELKNMYQFASDYPRHAVTNYSQEMERQYRIQKNPVMEARRFIDANFENDIGRSQVSEHVHLNPDYLDRLFKAEMKISVAHYIREQKIDKAKKLLRTTSLSVSEIASRVGYANPSNFTDSFKRLTKNTPLGYRKTHT